MEILDTIFTVTLLVIIAAFMLSPFVLVVVATNLHKCMELDTHTLRLCNRHVFHSGECDFTRYV